MKKNRLIIKKDSIMVVCMFIMLHDLAFLPDAIEQGIHISLTIFLFIYNAKHLSVLSPKKPLFWLLLSIAISTAYGFIVSSDHSYTTIVKGLLFLFSIFNVFELINYQFHRNNEVKMMKVLFRINLIYCLFALIFLNKVIRITSVGSNAYLFGSKFSTSYLFISLTCVFYMAYEKEMKSMIKYKLIFLLFSLLAAYVAYHLNCQTVVGISVVPLIMGSIRGKVSDKLYNWQTVMILIAFATLFPFFMELVLNIGFVQRLVVNFFDRDLTLSSRMKVYSRYLVPVIKKHIVLGYGYSNNAMRNYSNYYYNAQNGLLNYVIQFGVLGGGILVTMVSSSFRSINDRISNNNWMRGAVMLLYAMVIAGAVEVSYNWHFFLALALLYAAKAKYTNDTI